MACDCEHGATTTATQDRQGRIKRQGRSRVAMLEESPTMPISKYNVSFGGKPGSADKAMVSMQHQYGPKKGKSVFYATAHKRRPVSAMAAMQRR